MWFKLQPVALPFIAQAPFHFDNETVVEANAEDIFAILAATNWADWFEDFIAVKWLTLEPHGEGAAREVKLTTLSARERFLAWEPGRRYCFAIDEISVPLVSAMIEDIQLEPQGRQQTRIHWQVYYRPNPLMRVIHPLARRIFGAMFVKGLHRLKQQAEKQKLRQEVHT